MSNRCKVRSNWFSAGLVILNVFIITISTGAKYEHANFNNEPTESADTIPPKKNPRLLADTASQVKIAFPDSTKKNDTGKVRTIDTLNFKLSKDSLDAPINYTAEDSGVLIIPTRQFILYGKASTRYTDLELSAATILVEQSKHLVTAFGDKDTLGNPLDKPKLVQGGMTSNSDTIFYNLKTQKGLTKSTYLQEGEMFVYAEKVKKINSEELFAWRGRFTTCNLDTPHFAFRTRKMKIINKKLGMSGPAFPEFEGVPVPVGIPFGIYPLNRGRHSGILPPQLAANESFGLGLEGLGYYKVFSEYLDATVRTNIYSYGGWTMNLTPRYMKRYRYTGGFNIAIQKTKALNTAGKTSEEFSKFSSFQVSWNHTRDNKARPGTNFSANVNAGSTKFNQFVPNNTLQNFQNQLQSSITYSKDWRGKYNMTVSANHDQNSNSGLVNLRLPSASFNVVTFYPFQKKEAVGTPKWYEKLGIGYTGNLENQVSFYGSDTPRNRSLSDRIFDTLQWGANHNVPISLSLPQLGPVQISPSIAYSEKWYSQKIVRTWDPATKTVIQQRVRGFYTARETSFGISGNTRVFGTYQFGKSSNIKAIRHEVRPYLNLNYKPDLAKNYYKTVQVDSGGRTMRLSQFDGVIGGSYGEGRFGGVSFGIDNMLEMKVRNKKDTAKESDRKVRLIDGFGFGSSYNFFADSFKLAPFSIYLRSNLFEKVNITASAVLDPYETDLSGFRRNKLLWTGNKFKPGSITNGNIAISTSFKSKSKDGKSDEERLPKDEFMTPDEQQRQLDYVRSNPAEYTDFNIPWSLQLSYSLNFTKTLAADFSKFTTDIFSNVSINGDFSLTPRWKMGGTTYFDFKTAKIQTLTMFISREMHCWQMSINLTPVGLFRSFNITINPKSGILRDLKVNRSRNFSSL